MSWVWISMSVDWGKRGKRGELVRSFVRFGSLSRKKKSTHVDRWTESSDDQGRRCLRQVEGGSDHLRSALKGEREGGRGREKKERNLRAHHSGKDRSLGNQFLLRF